jgi:phosphoribosylformylglycinamidine synthase PurS subunit
MSIKVGVKILPRDVILDTQGRAVEQTLRQNNLPVERCRVGKYIELDISESSPELALRKADQIAKSLLCNALIEKFELAVIAK